MQLVNPTPPATEINFIKQNRVGLHGSRGSTALECSRGRHAEKLSIQHRKKKSTEFIVFETV